MILTKYVGISVYLFRHIRTIVFPICLGHIVYFPFRGTSPIGFEPILTESKSVVRTITLQRNNKNIRTRTLTNSFGDCRATNYTMSLERSHRRHIMKSEVKKFISYRLLAPNMLHKRIPYTYQASMNEQLSYRKKHE